MKGISELRLNLEKLEKVKQGVVREAVTFFCSAVSGAILLPVFCMIIFSFFGLIPRNENMAEGYAALLKPFDSHRWVVLIPIFAPYLLYHAARRIRRNRKPDPPQAGRPPREPR